MWLMLGFMLTGMTGPSCTQSEHPLSSPEDGFVDPYLVGTWYSAWISEEGLLDAETVFAIVEITADGEMRVVDYEADNDAPDIYRAWSTRLGADKYLNLQLIECPGCDEDGQRAVESGRCAYIIFRYFTYLPTDVLEEEFSDEELRLIQTPFDAMRGDLALYQYMDNSVVKDAIEAGEVEGEAECEDCVRTGACLAADERELRQFVAPRADELFISDIGMVSRHRTIERTADGLPIGMSRSTTSYWIENEGDFLITSASNKTILAVGTEAELGQDQYAIFSFEDQRLAGAVYSPIEEAPLLQRTVWRLINPWAEESESAFTEVWLRVIDGRHSASLLEEDKEALRICIADLEQEAFGDEQAAAEALTACMQERGRQLVMGKRPVQFDWPECTVSLSRSVNEGAQPPGPRPYHYWIPRHRACIDHENTTVSGRFVLIDSDEPLLVSDVILKWEERLIPRHGFEFEIQGPTRAAAVQIGNEDRPIVGEIGCAPVGTFQPEECGAPQDEWCRLDTIEVEGEGQLRCVNSHCRGNCMFHVVSDVRREDFAELVEFEEPEEIVIVGEED